MTTIMLQRAYKTRLKPTEEQEQKLRHYSAVVRFCYNLFLDWSEAAYKETGKRPATGDLIKRFRAERADGWAWTAGACSRCEETAGKMLEGAYCKFFELAKAGKLAEMHKGKRPRKDGKPHGFPRFKSRFDTPPAVGFWSVKAAHVEEGRVRLQGLGWVRLYEKGYLPTAGAKINRATVSYRAGRWFVSLQVEHAVEVVTPAGRPVGVDVGIKHLATTSDGRQFENPRALDRATRKLARLQRKLQRQKKGSRRRELTKEKIARTYLRVTDVRAAATHQASSEIVGVHRPADERPAALGIEKLEIGTMLEKRYMARRVLDANMSELQRQLRYKAEWHGEQIIEAEENFPSTRRCCECGHVEDEVALAKRTFKCSQCGAARDRDENAAVNLQMLCEA